MDIKKIQYLNGVTRKYKNRRVTLVTNSDSETYTLEFLNFQPEVAHIPCAKHKVLRDKVSVGTVALTRLSLIAAAISIMDILGAETKENLLLLEELAAILREKKLEDNISHCPSLLFFAWYYRHPFISKYTFLSQPNENTKPSDSEVDSDNFVIFHGFNDLGIFNEHTCLRTITEKCDELGVSLIVALKEKNLPYEKDFKHWGFEGVETLDKTKDYLLRKPKK